MAECDRVGNVNVSRFGSRLIGIGGFINISLIVCRVVFAVAHLPAASRSPSKTAS